MSLASGDHIEDMLLEELDGRMVLKRWLRLGTKIPKIPGYRYKSMNIYQRHSGTNYMLVMYQRVPNDSNK